MKFRTGVVIGICLSALLGACEASDTPKEEKTTETEQTEASNEVSNERFTENKYAKDLGLEAETIGKKLGNYLDPTFIKAVNAQDTLVVVSFAADAKEFAHAKGTKPSKEELAELELAYADYLQDVDNLSYIMLSLSTHLMYDFINMETIKIVIPYADKVYTSDVTREKLNELLGWSLEGLVSNGDANIFIESQVIEPALQAKFKENYIWETDK